jgi:signal transduction histidine kinase
MKSQKHIAEKRVMQSVFEQNLLQSKLEIQEQTFDAISQELHDNIGQLLSLAKVQLSIAEQRETADKVLIAEIKNSISHALTDLRDIAKSLNSGRIFQLTLYQCIEQELQLLSRSGVIQSNIVLEGTEQPVNEQKKTIIFRIIQECLQNILKHAQATEVEVCLAYGMEAVEVAIRDNGIGFDTETINRASGGLGLGNIKTRVALMQGNVNIESNPGSGTTIKLIIPYA